MKPLFSPRCHQAAFHTQLVHRASKTETIHQHTDDPTKLALLTKILSAAAAT